MLHWCKIYNFLQETFFCDPPGILSRWQVSFSLPWVRGRVFVVLISRVGSILWISVLVAISVLAFVLSRAQGDICCPCEGVRTPASLPFPRACVYRACVPPQPRPSLDLVALAFLALTSLVCVWPLCLTRSFSLWQMCQTEEIIETQPRPPESKSLGGGSKNPVCLSNASGGCQNQARSRNITHGNLSGSVQSVMLWGPGGPFSASVHLPFSSLSYHFSTKVGPKMSNLDIQAKMSWSHSILSYINLSWSTAGGGPVRPWFTIFCLCLIKDVRITKSCGNF